MNTNDPVSVIMLAHNEVETIEQELILFHEKIVTRLPGSEFIVAEDGSTDGTTEIITRLKRELGIIHLTSTQKQGYKNSLISAIQVATHEYLFLSDSGLKHDPDDFWRIYSYRENYDLIVGKKHKGKINFTDASLQVAITNI
jgi:glycosyltransferase involved in cell wall biosynthesis